MSTESTQLHSKTINPAVSKLQEAFDDFRKATEAYKNIAETTLATEKHLEKIVLAAEQARNDSLDALKSLLLENQTSTVHAIITAVKKCITSAEAQIASLKTCDVAGYNASEHSNIRHLIPREGRAEHLKEQIKGLREYNPKQYSKGNYGSCDEFPYFLSKPSKQTTAEAKKSQQIATSAVSSYQSTPSNPSGS